MQTTEPRESTLSTLELDRDVQPLWVPDGAEAVDVAIYNLLGQLVRQVWSGPLAAGEHRLTWDGRDGQGQPVASGAYLYQLRMGEQLRTRKMVKLE